MTAATPKTVTVETLPVILHQEERVITTDLLATLYGAKPINIQQNYANNRDRFVQGKHYFKLEGKELNKFKEMHCLDKIESVAQHRPSLRGSVEISPHTRNLTLWTERGAARHAKMLDTDEAWEVFEKLEDAYFGVSDDRPADTLTPSEQQLLTEFVQGKLEGHATEHHRKAIAEIWSRVHRKFRVTKYQQLPRAQLKDVIAYVQQMQVRALGQKAPDTEAADTTQADLFAPKDPLTSEVRAAINRRAHTLSLRHYDRLREDLIAAVRRHAEKYPQADLVSVVDSIDTRDSTLVCVHRADLWDVTSRAMIFAIASHTVSDGVHALERVTGEPWYGR